MVSVNNSASNEKLTLDMIDYKMKNLKERVLKQFLLSQMHLFRKSKKGREEAKPKILTSRTMITQEKDLSSREET